MKITRRINRAFTASDWHAFAKATLPAGLKAMLDYAASKKLKLMAYAYPSLPFLQNPEWTAYAWKQLATVRDHLGLNGRVTLAQFDGDPIVSPTGKGQPQTCDQQQSQGVFSSRCQAKKQTNELGGEPEPRHWHRSLGLLPSGPDPIHDLAMRGDPPSVFYPGSVLIPHPPARPGGVFSLRRRASATGGPCRPSQCRRR